MNRPIRTAAVRVAALILGAALGLTATGSLAQSQGDPQAVKPYRIIAVVWRGETEVEQGFRDYLTQRGIPFDMTVRNLNLDRGNAPPIVEEIKRVRPDLVYTWGTGTTSSIVGKIETDTPESFVRDIPGVFTIVAYPKAANIVKSFESPGRPVTGVAFLASVEAHLNTIRAYRPFVTIAVIYNEKASNSRINVAELTEAAPKAGMKIIAHESGVDAHAAKRLALLGAKTRNLREHGFQEGVSTRLLIYSAALIRGGIAPRRACASAIVQAVSDDAEVQDAVAGIVDAVWP